MASASDDESDFYAELDEFELQLPGGGSQTYPFSSNDVLVRMLRTIYPDWKEERKVTSIPIARVPQLFPHNLAMCKELEKILKATQKGELAERKLYQLFVNGKFPNQPGVIVFPNFNGSHIFQRQVAKVEIDMVLVHPHKGVFIFNVKNVGGKSTSQTELENDIKKHSNFIRMLMDYKSEDNNNGIILHNVLCNFNDDSAKLSDESEVHGTHSILNLTKKDFQSEIFAETWITEISNLETMTSSSSFEVLVARLVALNSLEGSAAVIHQQMKVGSLQSIKKRKRLQTQIQATKKDPEFEDNVISLSERANLKGRKKFILWTKEQMDIIAYVYEHLVNLNSRNGMHVLIQGCKGSGKTMLLVFIAKLAHCIFRSRDENDDDCVLVCDGSINNSLWWEQMRENINPQEFPGIALCRMRSKFFKFPLWIKIIQWLQRILIFELQQKLSITQLQAEFFNA